MAEDDDRPIRVRTLFLSDLHLGTRGCQAGMLLGFLRDYDADTIYLVGDIVDGWQLKSGWYWPQAHNDVVQKLLRKVRKGTHVVYLPGNHDEFLRNYVGTTFGGIEIADTAIHESADGRRYLVIHGDQFDMVMRHQRWLAHLGDGAYTLALWLNTILNRFRRRLGLSYWSLSAWAKLKVKNAVSFIGKFEEILAEEAKRRGAQGVICGHIHHAADRSIGDLRYLNTGDWVESCTGIIEHYDGRIEVIHYPSLLRAKEAEIRRRRRPSTSFRRGGEPSRETPDRERCVAPAGQRRGALPRTDDAAGARPRLHRLHSEPGRIPVHAPAGLSRDPPRLPGPGRLASRWDAAAPTHVHIATEGPVGFAVRRRCLAQRLPFTTAITRASPNTSPPARPCRRRGPTPICAASTGPRTARW